MRPFQLNEEEIQLIKDLRKVTLIQKDAFLSAVHILAAPRHTLEASLPSNVVPILAR